MNMYWYYNTSCVQKIIVTFIDLANVCVYSTLLAYMINTVISYDALFLRFLIPALNVAMNVPSISKYRSSTLNVCFIY